jgi:hypothetical protein
MWAFCNEISDIEVQWNLDQSFFKGVEKTNDVCGEMINPENQFF